MNVEEAAAAPVVVKAASAVTFAAAGSTLAFGLTAAWAGVIASFFLGVCALVFSVWMNYHFKQKHFNLVREYVMSGRVDRRKTGDEDDRREDVASPCTDCPLVKHRHDCDNT